MLLLFRVGIEESRDYLLCIHSKQASIHAYKQRTTSSHRRRRSVCRFAVSVQFILYLETSRENNRRNIQIVIVVVVIIMIIIMIIIIVFYLFGISFGLFYVCFGFFVLDFNRVFFSILSLLIDTIRDWLDIQKCDSNRYENLRYHLSTSLLGAQCSVLRIPNSVYPKHKTSNHIDYSRNDKTIEYSTKKGTVFFPLE